MGLDAVAVGVDDERRIIVRAVIGAKPGLAVVAPAALQRRGMEGVDAFARRRRKAEMQARFLVRRHRAQGGADPQRDRVAPIAERAFALVQTSIAERLQRRVVEALRLGDVADADREVVDHETLLWSENGWLPVTACHTPKPSS